MMSGKFYLDLLGILLSISFIFSFLGFKRWWFEEIEKPVKPQEIEMPKKPRYTRKNKKK